MWSSLDKPYISFLATLERSPRGMADTSQHLGGPGRVSVGTGDRGVRKVSASQCIFNLNEETESFPPSCPAHAGHCCCLLGIRAALELWAKGTAQQRINASERLLEVTAVSGVNHGPIEQSI